MLFVWDGALCFDKLWMNIGFSWFGYSMFLLLSQYTIILVNLFVAFFRLPTSYTMGVLNVYEVPFGLHSFSPVVLCCWPEWRAQLVMFACQCYAIDQRNFEIQDVICDPRLVLCPIAPKFTYGLHYWREGEERR